LRGARAAGNTGPAAAQRLRRQEPPVPEAPTLLLFRPGPQAAEFAAALDARLPGKFSTVAAPLTRIVELPGEIDLRGVQGLAFTSANAVVAFAARRLATNLPAWCVGDATAAAARAAGLAADSAGGDEAALAALVAAAHRPGAGSVLHLRGRHTAGDLAERLRAAGVPARAMVIYDQPALPLTDAVRERLVAGGPAVLAFFSPRTARLFVAEAEAAGWPLAPATAVSISHAADAALAGLGFGRRIVAPAPDRAGMLAALATL
jgi:uroporphyrinogen-III synthase